MGDRISVISCRVLPISIQDIAGCESNPLRLSSILESRSLHQWSDRFSNESSKPSEAAAVGATDSYAGRLEAFGKLGPRGLERAGLPRRGRPPGEPGLPVGCPSATPRRRAAPCSSSARPGRLPCPGRRLGPPGRPEHTAARFLAETFLAPYS